MDTINTESSLSEVGLSELEIPELSMDDNNKDIESQKNEANFGKFYQTSDPEMERIVTKTPETENSEVSEKFVFPLKTKATSTTALSQEKSRPLAGNPKKMSLKTKSKSQSKSQTKKHSRKHSRKYHYVRQGKECKKTIAQYKKMNCKGKRSKKCRSIQKKRRTCKKIIKHKKAMQRKSRK